MKTVYVGAVLYCMALSANACELSTTAQRVEYGANPRVYVGASQRQIAGQTSPDGFVPTFPWSANVKYRVESEGCPSTNFKLRQKTDQPSVIGVYPDTEHVPENILRFYVRFSTPMREGDFLSHLTLTDLTTGEDLTGVFFDNVYELWSPDRRQITLLVDPGRVKTGLTANVKLGRAFTVGHKYSLSISDDWRSLSGEPLSAPYLHTFLARPEDRKPVDPATWQLTMPPAGTDMALRISFGEPVDHVSISTYLRSTLANGAALPGTWRIAEGGSEAYFTPNTNWVEGVYRLQINARFEDIAANNLNGAFDHAPEALLSENEGWGAELKFQIQPNDGD